MKILKEYLMISLGVLMVAAGIYFFKFPNNFSTGGVSGISVILSKIFPMISKSLFVLIINMALLALGFLVLGRAFAFKTVYGSVLLSLLLYFFEKFVPLSQPMTAQPFLELTFSILLPAFGSALLFNLSASTGGTDIAAMIIKKNTSLDIGKALFCTDILITLGSFFAFGIETGLFSILGLLSKALIVDAVIENINLSKYFMIVTSQKEEIAAYINKNLHRGATTWPASGAFTGEKRDVILTAVRRPQAIALRRFSKSVDPHSFMVVSNTSEIIGKGFRDTF